MKRHELIEVELLDDEKILEVAAVVPDVNFEMEVKSIRSAEFRIIIIPPANNKQALSNLLAIIHRDGGHYELEHGTEKAIADAMEVVRNDRNSALADSGQDNSERIYMVWCQKLVAAIKCLSFAAQTSGGWETDAELVAAIANANETIGLVECSKAIDIINKLEGDIIQLQARVQNRDDEIRALKDSGQEAICKIIEKTLNCYRMTNVVDADGDALPLVDLLSGSGGTIEAGKREIEYIVDAIFLELPSSPPAREGWQSSCENCGEQLQPISCTYCGHPAAPSTAPDAQDEKGDLDYWKTRALMAEERFKVWAQKEQEPAREGWRPLSEERIRKEFEKSFPKTNFSNAWLQFAKNIEAAPQPTTEHCDVSEDK